MTTLHVDYRPEVGIRTEKRGNLADFVPETALRVVIADDSEKNREAIREMVTKFVELDVTEAETGHQCLTLLATGEFDAVFVILTMPNSHGFTVLKAVSDGSIPRPHFVAVISEWTDLDHRRPENESYQLDAVIEKPFTFNDVQSVLSDLVASTLEDDLLAGLIA
jgi:CheY-like chemotaxis protein